MFLASWGTLTEKLTRMPDSRSASHIRGRGGISACPRPMVPARPHSSHIWGDPLVSSLSQPYHSRSSSPIGDNSTLYAPTATRVRNASPLPPSQIVNVSQRDALDHGVRCGNCNEWIMGRRYQCANCPSDPVGFNLVSSLLDSLP